jgi:isoquinoline 1-oxidoreductase beta subunit
MKLAMQLGASARERLKAAAAARWSAPVSQIDARNSILKHMPSGRTLRYGEVAAEAAKIQLASEPGLKPQSEWTFIGKASPPKINLPEIVKGTAGMPQSWKAHACTMGLPLFFGFYDTPYAVSRSIPSVEIGTSSLAAHVLTGAYRGPCYNSHAFMVETFVDECAAAARIDPLEYRLRLLSNWDPAWSSCLKVAAEKSGWGTPLKKGQGRGIAIANWPAAGQKQAGSTVCAAAFVEVSRQGALQVKSVDVAFDCGRMANRDAVLAQLEGGTIFGLNMTVNEEITVQNGAVVESNFDRYPVMRMGEIPPRINVHFDALSGHDRFAIIGEAPVGPVGAAVGNAIFQATGKRLRSTPFRKHDLTWS